jgi:hypothetical protein
VAGLILELELRGELVIPSRQDGFGLQALALHPSMIARPLADDKPRHHCQRAAFERRNE